MANAIPFRDAYEHMKFLPGFDSAAEAVAASSSQSASQYVAIPASSTDYTLGATGATGDYLAGLLVVPATTSPGSVIVVDNVTPISVFSGGASSVSNLVPFFIPLGILSVGGAWKVTTGADVSVIAVGNFS